MIYIADKNGVVDSIYHTLIKYINTKYDIILSSWVENFQFNPELLDIKDYILFSFEEYGWDWDLNKSGSHIWGVNSENFPRYYNGDWVKFDNWVKENPPLLIFKRELLKRDESEKVLPIDYPCNIPAYPISRKEEFNARPISVMNYWGRSHEARVRLHGNIWKHASKRGYSVCDNIYHFDQFMLNEKGEKWVSLWMPHYARIDISNIIALNGLSKLSMALPGAGLKTFRHSESPINSVMVKYRDNLSWSFPWDESNCILCDEGKEIEAIEEALQDEYLYDVYLEGVKQIDKYRLPNYIAHLESKINEFV